MDRDTLLGHKELWGEEPRDRRCLHDLDALDDEERTLYDDLRFDRLGERVRLERERIGYSQVLAAIARICRQEVCGGDVNPLC